MSRNRRYNPQHKAIRAAVRRGVDLRAFKGCYLNTVSLASRLNLEVGEYYQPPLRGANNTVVGLPDFRMEVLWGEWGEPMWTTPHRCLVEECEEPDNYNYYDLDGIEVGAILTLRLAGGMIAFQKLDEDRWYLVDVEGYSRRPYTLRGESSRRRKVFTPWTRPLSERVAEYREEKAQRAAKLDRLEYFLTVGAQMPLPRDLKEEVLELWNDLHVKYEERYAEWELALLDPESFPPEPKLSLLLKVLELE